MNSKKGITKLSLIFLLVFAALLAVMSLSAFAHSTDLYFFYGQGCPHCSREEIFLDEMQEKYTDLNILSYEVYSNQTSRVIFQEMVDAYGTTIEGVPTTFINGKVFVGFSGVMGNQIEQEIQACFEDICNITDHKDVIKITGDSSPKDDPGKTETMKKLTVPAVIAASLVDAINPCAFAVLIILMSTILISKNKKKALFSGLAFSLAIFISYFLMGLGLYSAIQATGISRIFLVVVASLAILIGLFNLKDYLWYGKWFVMEVPRTWRPAMKRLIRGVTSVPGAFGVGFVVSLFLLPCTSGPYIVILGLLAQAATRSYAIMMLLLYNIIFILPMLIITIVIYAGAITTEQADRWRTKRLKVLHLIAGIIILILGIGMFVAMGLGLI